MRVGSRTKPIEESLFDKIQKEQSTFMKRTGSQPGYLLLGQKELIELIHTPLILNFKVCKTKQGDKQVYLDCMLVVPIPEESYLRCSPRNLEGILC